MKEKIALLLWAFLPTLLFAQVTPQMISQAQSGNADAMFQVGHGYENGAGVEQDSAQALQWFQKAADKGSAKAWMQVALYTLEGIYTPADTARCYAIRKEWADKGYPDAIAYLGNCYKNGFGVAADTVRAVALWKEAAKKGSSLGLFQMAIINSENFSEKQRIDYLKKAAKKDVSMASVLGSFYYSNNEYSKAWECIQEGLKWNEPPAMGIAANLLFRFGEETQRLYPHLNESQAEAEAQRIISQAVTLYPTHDMLLRTAAMLYYYPSDEQLRNTMTAKSYLQQGDRYDGLDSRRALVGIYLEEELYDSAAYYLYRIIDTKDNQDMELQGESCYQLADMSQNVTLNLIQIDCESILLRGVNEFKHAGCALMLGNYYASLDEESSALKAEQYYLLAEQLGHPDATEMLGLYYEYVSDSRRATEYFQKMADQGNPKGYALLARMALDEFNNTLAISYLEQGSKKGCTDCAETLGDLYAGFITADNIYYEIDYKKAVKYYNMSKNAGSYYSLALLYLEGHVGKQSKKDIAKGLKYMETSAEMGYINSIYLLGKYYEKGQYVDNMDMEQALFYYQLLADNGVAAGIYKVGEFYELGKGGLEQNSAMALEYYERAANMDYSKANTHLGDLYREGRIVAKNEESAFHYYSHAVMQEDAEGTYRMACCYLEGCGVSIDSTEALTWLREAAALESGDAAFLLAKFFDLGQAGLTADGDSAIYYYKMAHANGNGDASCYIGKLLIREGYYNEAFQYFYVASQRGSVDGMVMLALCMQQGVGIEANPVAAYQILENACRLDNNARAYTQLGLACLQGNGCPENELLGMTYLDTAAHLGSSDAMYYLGICYLQGYGCEPDSATAMIWLNRAMDNGSASACNLVGDLYEGREEYTDAVRCYEKAVELGSMNGYCNLGYCYEKGQGVVLNSQKAFELYKTAAENGSARGCKMVASCYLEGIYVEADAPQALNWYIKAAEMGDEQAMFYVGVLYEQGEDGIRRDLKAAKQWYERSAAMGYEPAEAALNRLKKK